ncbi:unnamed protein product, partial [Rotaria sp. Silwood1]
MTLAGFPISSLVFPVKYRATAFSFAQWSSSPTG